MAIVQNPLIGRASGKYGQSVFTTQFGRNVVKTKALTVNDAKSDSQVERRNALSQIVAIYKKIASAAKAGFKALAIGKSAYNAFSSYNLNNAFTYSGTTPATFIEADFLVSKGAIESIDITTISSAAADADVDFTFPTTTTGAGQSATDLAIAVVWNETQDIWGSNVALAARSTGAVSVTMSSAAVESDVIHGYLGFTNVGGSAQSNSVYDTTDTTA